MTDVNTFRRSDFAGTRRLLRLAVRRDRVTLVAWAAGMAMFVAATTAMFGQSLARQADLVRETQMVATNAGMRLLGLTSGPSVGGYLLHREYVTLAVLAALMSMFAVIRHTRQNEELGRAEILGSTVVGRYADLAAGVVVAAAANVLLALLVARGDRDQRAASCWCDAGRRIRCSGRTGLGGSDRGDVPALSHDPRSRGDLIGRSRLRVRSQRHRQHVGKRRWSRRHVTSAWPAWLSPIGWGQQTRPFGGGHWWPLLIAVAALRWCCWPWRRARLAT